MRGCLRASVFGLLAILVVWGGSPRIAQAFTLAEQNALYEIPLEQYDFYTSGQTMIERGDAAKLALQTRYDGTWYVFS